MKNSRATNSTGTQTTRRTRADDPYEHPPRIADRDRDCIICRKLVPRHAPDRVDIWLNGVIVAGCHEGCLFEGIDS